MIATDELRKTADMAANLDDFERVSIPWMRNKLAPMLREAADTIENLRDRLLKAERACDAESYDAGFDNGMKAVLQQLDGLIHEGADVDEVRCWIDRQWEEES